jgi:hypothetical protein
MLMGCTSLPLSGLGKMERERLAAILRDTGVTISVLETADILGLPPHTVAL